jgi:hypothetical protein
MNFLRLGQMMVAIPVLLILILSRILNCIYPSEGNPSSQRDITICENSAS